MADGLNIHTTASPDYTIRTRLDGKDYTLRFLWNQREGRWYMSIADDSGVDIVTSLKLVCEVKLLAPFRADPAVPPGEFLVLDLTGDRSPPGFDELGVDLRCTLVYFPDTDL